jgi:two-component system phosphate regulon response regulator PhoB
MRRKILVVEDDPQSVEHLSFNLRSAGFQVVVTSNGHSAALLAGEDRPSLIILGLAFPHIQAFEACRHLKSSAAAQDIPLIIVSSHAREQDRILGFELGADDYVQRPFSVLELVLRIRKSIQRTLEKQSLPPAKLKMVIGELALDPTDREVSLKNETIRLTPIQFKLMSLFMERKGCALDRETIVSAIWGHKGNSYSRGVDAHIKRIRQVNRRIGSAIETINGFGYRLNEGPLLSSESLTASSPVRVLPVAEPDEKAKPRFPGRKNSTFLDPAPLLAGSVA